MSDFKRVNDTRSKRTSRVLDTFMGSHYGTGKTDQGRNFGYLNDFDVVNKKLELRNGKRRNQLYGYSNSITGVIDIHIGGLTAIGNIQGGTLSVYPLSDMKKQVRRYYTWAEVERTFTWDTLGTKTWGELLTGSDREDS